MKTIGTILLLLVCLKINAQTLDGKWVGKMDSPNGTFELTFNFKTDAAVLNGDVSSQMGTIQLENGKVNGNEFSFDINFNGQVINHTGVLNGNIIKLILPMIDQPM